MNSWRSAMLLVVAAWLVGCGTSKAPRDYTPTHARFFLEAAGNAAGMPVVLPRSGVNITVNVKPVLTENDFVNVELTQVDLGKCLRFELTPSAARDFVRLSGSHQGRRLALAINEVPLGARRIDGMIMDGLIYIFVEVPDEELPRLVENLKKTSAAVQRELRQKG